MSAVNPLRPAAVMRAAGAAKSQQSDAAAKRPSWNLSAALPTGNVRPKLDGGSELPFVNKPPHRGLAAAAFSSCYACSRPFVWRSEDFCAARSIGSPPKPGKIALKRDLQDSYYP